MSKLLLAAVLVSLVGSATGCASPGYSGGWPTVRFPERKQTGEMSNQYIRQFAYDFEQITDDFNDVMLLDAPSRLSKWNIR
ncbi:MAG: hypothetical protein ABSH20_05320 [Tepidisphaeraceae bacterium]|jgi:hypothetical protein